MGKRFDKLISLSAIMFVFIGVVPIVYSQIVGFGPGLYGYSSGSYYNPYNPGMNNHYQPDYDNCASRDDHGGCNPPEKPCREEQKPRKPEMKHVQYCHSCNNLPTPEKDNDHNGKDCDEGDNGNNRYLYGNSYPGDYEYRDTEGNSYAYSYNPQSRGYNPLDNSMSRYQQYSANMRKPQNAFTLQYT